MQINFLSIQNNKKTLQTINLKHFMAKRKQKSGKIAGFIIKLIEILKNKENEDIVFYNEQERSFTIKNIRKFTEQILPKYFKHKNYSSFVRQVNLYGFHKIRHLGKQETFNQDFFAIFNHKNLQKIKRKPMGSGSEKIKLKKKQENSSDDSEYNASEMDEEFSQCQSQRKKSQKSNSQEMAEISMQLDDLQKKKVILQTQIKKEQQQHQRLQIQNIKLKTDFNIQNTQFYNELLKILQSLIISQYNLGEIKRSTYDKIVIKIYQEKDKLNQAENENHRICDVSKREGKIQKVKYFEQSKFLSLVKEKLNKKKEYLTIPGFIQSLLHFIQNQNSYLHNHKKNAVPDPLFVNYDPYYISNQSCSREQKKQKQSYEQKRGNQEKVKKFDYFKTESKEQHSMKIMGNKISNNTYKQIKLKKGNKRKDQNSDDQEYVPKNNPSS